MKHSLCAPVLIALYSYLGLWIQKDYSVPWWINYMWASCKLVSNQRFDHNYMLWWILEFMNGAQVPYWQRSKNALTPNHLCRSTHPGFFKVHMLRIAIVRIRATSCICIKPANESLADRVWVCYNTNSIAMMYLCTLTISFLYAVFKLAPIRSALGLPRLGQMSQGTGVSAAAVAVNAAGQPVQSFSTRPVKSSQTPSSQSSSSSEQPKTSHRQRRSQRQRRKSWEFSFNLVLLHLRLFYTQLFQALKPTNK